MTDTCREAAWAWPAMALKRFPPAAAPQYCSSRLLPAMHPNPPSSLGAEETVSAAERRVELVEAGDGWGLNPYEIHSEYSPCGLAAGGRA
eukprot:CAMPEP_0202827736 /NCGR_PEP_ID=MMETSP1389-20130828/14482_1 /ASSEMBLY_ACC=CAM_ASM_000865 /TAXON_ID=302021 /ORGANISM="Rhodomonas sp., Strain CCMP768" /LENGTH=89 /DNA_ID=CAMNT_0049501175 /DNA_START=87 /DNA_END=357 /DNA_ORIENTATION=+